MIEQEQKSPDNTGKIQENKDDKGRFKPGVSGNPAGKPLGSRNQSTLFDEAIKKIAKLGKVKVEDIEVDIAMRGLIEAKKGNYNFYRDFMDRKFGPPARTLEIKGGLITPAINIFLEKNQEVIKMADSVKEAMMKQMKEGNKPKVVKIEEAKVKD